MIAPDAAWEIVLQQVQPLEPAELPLEAALYACLAEDVRADRDVPPANRSTMDGYAVRRADLAKSPCVLRVTGEVAAGSPRRPQVRPGSAVRIFTGANLPAGADTVVMLEQTEAREGRVTIHPCLNTPAHLRLRGEDARKGAVLLPRGTRLGGTEIGVCVSAGKASVVVHRRPKVAILCTGSELRPVRGRVRRHEIRNSIGPSLSAALAEWGIPRVRFQTLPDQPGVLLATLRRKLLRHEVVLFTGGVSAGSYDFVRSVVEAAGAAIRFHGLAMRPGKPTLYATAPAGRHVFGLPGNPLSALTAFHEFALPALRRLSGYPSDSCRPAWRVPLAAEARPMPDRVRCELARLVNHSDGLAAVAVPSHSSADLVAAGRVDGVILLPPSRKPFPAGQLVTFRPWRRLP